MAAFCSPMPVQSPYQVVVGQASMLSGLFLLFTMLLASRLEKRQLQCKALEGQKGWASVSRDVLNGLAAGVLFFGFSLRGYSGPDCLFFSVSVSAVLAGLHAALRRVLYVEGFVALLWLFFVGWGDVAQRILGLMKDTLFY